MLDEADWSCDTTMNLPRKLIAVDLKTEEEEEEESV